MMHIEIDGINKHGCFDWHIAKQYKALIIFLILSFNYSDRCESRIAKARWRL